MLVYKLSQNGIFHYQKIIHEIIHAVVAMRKPHLPFPYTGATGKKTYAHRFSVGVQNGGKTVFLKVLYLIKQHIRKSLIQNRGKGHKAIIVFIIGKVVYKPFQSVYKLFLNLLFFKLYYFFVIKKQGNIIFYYLQASFKLAMRNTAVFNKEIFGAGSYYQRA